ncbi:MAG: GNAT family N-acetyltransferase [Bdellovibrio sp.]
MNCEIRRAVHADAINIINAHRRSIREVCSKDYTAEQVAAWSGLNFKEDRWHQTMDQDLVWVISDRQNHIFGFGHLQFLENNQAEIAGLYFVPEVIGDGNGKKIVQLMLQECQKRKIQLIKLFATKTARAFYEKVGFKQIGQDAEVKIGGKSIECFRMEMVLIESLV